MTAETPQEAPVDPPAFVPTPFAIIYGHSGLGKTRFLTDIPNVLVLDMRGEVRVAPSSGSVFSPQSCQHLTKIRASAATNTRKFHAIGIDGLAKLYDLVLNEAGAGRIDWKGERANRNIQSWHKIAGPWLEDWILGMIAAGVPVVANTHRKIEKTVLRDKDVYKVLLDLPTGVRERLEKAADVILYVQMLPGATNSQWMARPAISLTERGTPGSKGWDLTYRPEEWHLTAPKDRYLALPPRSDLSWPVFASALGLQE